MKKTILLLATMAAMTTACTNDETLEVTTPQAITFSNVFIDNATRAAIDNSYSNQNMFTAFDVYGTITNSSQETANIFKQEKVEKKGTDWSYSEANTQYWIPGNTYNFTAIVNGNIENVTQVVAEDASNGMPTAINLSDASKQNDILLAELEEPIAYTSGAETVEFTFKHILAKAKFTVKNAITTDNGYSYKVSNVQITDATKNGFYTIDNGWEAATTPETYNVEFGNIVETVDETGADASDIAYGLSYESNWERLLIPASNATINVSFKQELFKSNVLIETKETVTAHATNVTLEAGHAYNFYIELGNPGEPIKFSVKDITGWDTDINEDETTDEKDNIEVNNN